MAHAAPGRARERASHQTAPRALQAILLSLCVGMMATALFKMRLYYQYQMDVPLAGIRFHLRHVLQRLLLRRHADLREAGINRRVASKHSAARLTPGACTQLLDPVVYEAVNHVWGFVFQVPTILAGLVASFVAGVVTQKYYGLIIPCLYVGSTLTAWLSVVIVFAWYKNAQQELAHLKIMWNIRYGGLAGEQIADIIESPTLPAAVSDEMIEHKHTTYARAAFIYRKRAFQMFFMNLVFEDSVAVVQAFVYGGAFIYMAHIAMDGKGEFGAATFAAGASLLMSGMSQSHTLAHDLSALVYGHAALLQLSDIFNEDHVMAKAKAKQRSPSPLDVQLQVSKSCSCESIAE